MLLLGTAELAAQSIVPVRGLGAGIGYVAAPPDALLGLQVLTMHPSGWGLFSDLVASHDSPSRTESFVAGWTAAEAEDHHGDQRFQTVYRAQAFHAGAVHALTPAFALYVGGGLTSRKAFSEFDDSGRERGDDFGYYWVRDVERSSSGVSGVVGAYLLATPRIAAHVGATTTLDGIRLGATYLIGSEGRR